MSNILVQLDHITAGYNGETVLRDVSITVKPNDFIGVIGPNGGGKTTMIKVLLGLLEPFKGQVLFPSGKIKIGYLPQASQIDRTFPISVKEVVESGLKIKNQWWPILHKKQKLEVPTFNKNRFS
jgi:zinc transport system ATP-binding protein